MESKRTLEANHAEEAKPGESRSTPEASPPIPRKSFIQLLYPFSGEYTSTPLWRLVIGPLIVLANPAVIWAVVLLAFPTLWIVSVNLLIAQIFAAPPFLRDTAELGYMSAGPAVGGFLGSLAAGALSDPIIQWASRKNKDIYEPEFRLILTIPAIILSAIGYFPFGYLIEMGRALSLCRSCGASPPALFSS